MDLDLLLHPVPPWLLLLPTTEAAACDALWALQRSPAGRAVAARLVRGDKAATAAGLFDQFAAALQFPCYFGENWDAFEECLTDLEWLPADAYAVFVSNADRLLDREPLGQLQVFVEVVERVAREWAAPAEEPPRPARAFHVVLQCAAGGPDVLRDRLRQAGASPGVVS